MPSKLAIAILAGGLSARMGRDKSKVRLGRSTLLGHVRASASELKLPIRVIRKDIVARSGPLGGIYTALATSRAQAELFLSCDMPFVSSQLLRRIVAASRAGEHAVFTTDDAGVGFPSLLPVHTLGTVESQIKGGDLSLQSLADAVKARRLFAKPNELLNINTPQDLEFARQRKSKSEDSHS